MKPEIPAVTLAEDSPLSQRLAGLELTSLAILAQHGLLRPLLRQVVLSRCLADEHLTEEESRQALLAFTRERGLGNQSDLETYLQSQLLSREALTLQLERPLRLARHCERLYRPKAEARFLERKTQLDRVVYSLLRLRDEGLARELYLQLQEGEANFADLAASLSEGPERATRGIVGPVSLTQAHPQLVRRLRTAPPGEVQEPFRIEQWWLVFRLETFIPASFDEAMAHQMSHELFEQWLDAEVDAQMAQVRELLQITAQIEAQ